MFNIKKNETGNVIDGEDWCKLEKQYLGILHQEKDYLMEVQIKNGQHLL